MAFAVCKKARLGESPNPGFRGFPMCQFVDSHYSERNARRKTTRVAKHKDRLKSCFRLSPGRDW